MQRIPDSAQIRQAIERKLRTDDVSAHWALLEELTMVLRQKWPLRATADGRIAQADVRELLEHELPVASLAEADSCHKSLRLILGASWQATTVQELSVQLKLDDLNRDQSAALESEVQGAEYLFSAPLWGGGSCAVLADMPEHLSVTLEPLGDADRGVFSATMGPIDPSLPRHIICAMVLALDHAHGELHVRNLTIVGSLPEGHSYVCIDPELMHDSEGQVVVDRQSPFVDVKKAKALGFAWALLDE